MIKKLMSYIGEYKRDTLLSPISVTFEVILEVLLPMLMAKVIDNGVEAGNMNYGTADAGSCHALSGSRNSVRRICSESIHGIW